MTNKCVKLTLLLTILVPACVSAGCDGRRERGNSTTKTNQRVEPPGTQGGGGDSQSNVAGTGQTAAVPMTDAAGAGAGEPAGRDADGHGAPGGQEHEAPGAWQVLSISGKWVQASEPGRTLVRGDILAPGAVLRLGEFSEGASVTLLDPHNRFLRRACARAEDCRGWKLPEAHAADSTSSRIIRSALDGLKHESEVLIDPVSRGAELKDAVLLFSREGVDIRPALGRLAPGRHVFEFEAVGGARAGASPARSELRIGGDPAAAVEVAGLTRGLYRMRLAGDSDEPGGGRNVTSMVLISPPETYRDRLARFRRAQALTRQWGDRVEPDVVQGFLRAYLSQLSKEGEAAG